MNSLVPLKRRSRRIDESRNPTTCFDMNVMSDDNLLIEILIRVPVKCANRYKCVSKSWNSLISHPYFARRFIHHLSTKSLSSLPNIFIFSWGKNIKKDLYITPDDSEVYKSPRLYSSINQYDEVVASYNDLTLCRAGNKSGFQNGGADVYYICNPLTNQRVELPPAPAPPPRHEHHQACYGFYCDNNNNTCQSEYAIVRIPLYRYVSPVLSNMKYKLEIFSSQTNKWSQSYVSCHHHGKARLFVSRTNSVFYNQILYMLCYTNIFRYEPFRIHDDDDGDDDDDAGSHTIDFPSDFKLRNYSRNNCLGLCQGRLRLSQYIMHAAMLCVWELKEDQNKGSNWCLKHKVFPDQMASENSELVQLFKTKPNVYSIIFQPCDADIVYLSLSSCTVVCNLRCMTIEHASFFSPGQCLPSTRKFPLVLRWPTPVPTLM